MEKYINAMKDIKTSEKLKKRIIKGAKENNKKCVNFLYSKKKVTIIITCVMTIIILFLIPYVTYEKNNEREIFSMLVYANDIEVKQNVEFLLGKYNLAMSSSPGFPLKVICEKSDYIKLSVDYGDFLLWDPSDTDGKIIYKDKMLQIKSGETVYWSPLIREDNKLAESCIISISAYRGEQEVKKNVINIKSDNSVLMNYSGILIE